MKELRYLHSNARSAASKPEEQELQVQDVKTVLPVTKNSVGLHCDLQWVLVERQMLFRAVRNKERLVCMGMLCWSIKRSSINGSKPENRISLEEHSVLVLRKAIRL